MLAGPVEATAIGNVLVQAIGLGLLGSLAEAREVVRRSFEVKTYTPRDRRLGRALRAVPEAARGVKWLESWNAFFRG